MRFTLGLLAAIAAAAVMAGGFWVAGFDFNQRGENACVVYWASMFSAAIGFCFAQLLPVFTEKP